MGHSPNHDHAVYGKDRLDATNGSHVQIISSYPYTLDADQIFSQTGYIGIEVKEEVTILSITANSKKNGGDANTLSPLGVGYHPIEFSEIEISAGVCDCIRKGPSPEALPVETGS
jgi:hypothetical protein